MRPYGQDAVPDKEDIVAHIRAAWPRVGVVQANNWAVLLTGLRWGLVRPLCAIAAQTGTHPVLAAMHTAAKSDEEAVREEINRHLAEVMRIKNPTGLLPTEEGAGDGA